MTAMTDIDPIVGARANLINALIGDTTPASGALIKSLADTIRDRREHSHNRVAEDLYCGNLASWAGERMAPVLHRLLGAEAEAARLRAELEQVRAAAIAEAAEAVLSTRGPLVHADSTYAAYDAVRRVLDPNALSIHEEHEAALQD